MKSIFFPNSKHKQKKWLDHSSEKKILCFSWLSREHQSSGCQTYVILNILLFMFTWKFNTANEQQISQFLAQSLFQFKILTDINLTAYFLTKLINLQIVSRKQRKLKHNFIEW